MSQASGNRGNGIRMTLSDVKRAYLNALSRRELYAALLREDPGYIEGQCNVRRLRWALYGTRDAAQLWQ